MAAPNSQTLTPQSAEAPHEPSMEDILASIRRIIASDHHLGHARNLSSTVKPITDGRLDRSAETHPTDESSASETSDSSAAEAPDFSGLQDLDALVLPPAPAEVNVDHGADRRDDVMQAGILSSTDDDLVPSGGREPSAEPVFDLLASDRVPHDPEPLMSSLAGASISTSFQALANTVQMNDPEMIERIARETLRPMLKGWLDENLPSMVERLVRAEIERVARGGRSRN